MAKNLKEFKTVEQTNEFEEIIKKSRFISQIFPIATEKQAQEIIKRIKKNNPKANHVCSAWILAKDPPELKFSDDGEPSGTAGKPILENIKNNQLYNVLVTVTRYFGGIKLGAGGLVRAYSSGASNVINNSKIVEVKPYQRLIVILDYKFYDTLNFELKNHSFKANKVEYLDKIKIEFLIDEKRLDDFINLINEMTGGQAEILFLENIVI